MSKAILIIDTPKCCVECFYHRYIELLGCNYCVADIKNIRLIESDEDDESDLYNRRKNWCPLRPMPQKKEVKEINAIDDVMKSDIQIIYEKVTAKIMLDTELLIASGYNLCIDEILGEENE